MARAVVSVVRWDDSTGVPPEASAIARACEAGLDLFLATAREARPAAPEELRRVAQLGILQARSSQSVDPILAAYRIAARVAWEAILRAWRGHPEVTPEALMLTANYVFAALDQVAAEVTKTYLHAREQHMQRGTRARGRLFHALISENFDSDLELQKQALTLNMPRGAIFHTTDPTTLVTLWPADSAAGAEGARDFVTQLNAEAVARSGSARARVRAGIGGYHTGLRGVSRSYLEAQQALEAGRKLRPDAVVYRHDEVIPYLLMAQNPVLAERFVQDSLGPVLASTKGRDQMLETLEAYLASGSIKEAATTLKLHRHTVLYRLDRLKDLLGQGLDEPAMRLRLQLALDLRKLL